MRTKQIDITQLDPSGFSPELQKALIRFGDAFIRLSATGYAKETTPGGTTVRKLTTADPSIGTEYDASRAHLLTHRAELPQLAQLDYRARGLYVEKALGRHATSDEIAEELEAEHRHIRMLEDRLAVVGFKLKLKFAQQPQAAQEK